MVTIKTLIRELVISLGSVEDPIKLLLGDLWDQVILPKDQKEILLDALYLAIKDEMQGKGKIAWTRSDLEPILTKSINPDQINYQSIDRGDLAKTLKVAFEDVAFIPSRTKSNFDFEQISHNIVVRTLSKFESIIIQPENHHLRDKLIEKYARSLGKTIEETNQEVFNLLAKYSSLEQEVVTLSDQVSDLNRIMKRVADTLDTMKDAQGKPSMTRFPTLREQQVISAFKRLESYYETLCLYNEKWANFVDPTNIPLQDKKNVALIGKEIEEIHKELELA